MADEMHNDNIAEIAATRRSPVKTALLISALVLLLAAGGGAFCGYRLLYLPIPFAQPRTFVVERHATLGQVARILQREGFIPSGFALRVYARLSGNANMLKAGEYEVESGLRPIDILDLLNSGRVKSYWLTIPEGKWVNEIDPLLATHWPRQQAAFRALASQPGYWQQKVPFPLPVNSLEGYLFPDTYLLGKDSSAQQIVAALLDGFTRRCYAEYTARPPRDGRTLAEVVTLASLVEAEAKVDAERPIIAGVYMNRLRRGMRLQCDATVLYAHRQRLTRVLYRDLEIDSPYNTYRYPGLPAGPICNPGLRSFSAALHPADVSYLYYVARGDGTHIFSHTQAEHEAAIRQVRGK